MIGRPRPEPPALCPPRAREGAVRCVEMNAGGWEAKSTAESWTSVAWRTDMALRVCGGGVIEPCTACGRASQGWGAASGLEVAAGRRCCLGTRRNPTTH